MPKNGAPSERPESISRDYLLDLLAPLYEPILKPELLGVMLDHLIAKQVFTEAPELGFAIPHDPGALFEQPWKARQSLRGALAGFCYRSETPKLLHQVTPGDGKEGAGPIDRVAPIPDNSGTIADLRWNRKRYIAELHDFGTNAGSIIDQIIENLQGQTDRALARRNQTGDTPHSSSSTPERPCHAVKPTANEESPDKQGSPAQSGVARDSVSREGSAPVLEIRATPLRANNQLLELSGPKLSEEGSKKAKQFLSPPQPAPNDKLVADVNRAMEANYDRAADAFDAFRDIADHLRQQGPRLPDRQRSPEPSTANIGATSTESDITFDPCEKAIVLLLRDGTNPRSIRHYAENVGVAHTTLSRNETWKRAWCAAKMAAAKPASQMPSGHKDKDGNLEAWIDEKCDDCRQEFGVLSATIDGDTFSLCESCASRHNPDSI